MTVFADLHTHTAASAGQYTPAEPVRVAKTRGLDLLAAQGLGPGWYPRYTPEQKDRAFKDNRLMLGVIETERPE